MWKDFNCMSSLNPEVHLGLGDTAVEPLRKNDLIDESYIQHNTYSKTTQFTKCTKIYF